MSKSTLCKWSKTLGLSYKRRNKEMQMHQEFDADIVPSVCNFIKSRLWQRCFLVDFVRFKRKIILRNICKRLLLMIRSLLHYFVRFVVHQNAKWKNIKDNCFLKKFMYLFNICKIKPEGKDNIITILIWLNTNSRFI